MAGFEEGSNDFTYSLRPLVFLCSRKEDMFSATKSLCENIDAWVKTLVNEESILFFWSTIQKRFGTSKTFMSRHAWETGVHISVLSVATQLKNGSSCLRALCRDWMSQNEEKEAVVCVVCQNLKCCAIRLEPSLPPMRSISASRDTGGANEVCQSARH